MQDDVKDIAEEGDLISEAKVFILAVGGAESEWRSDAEVELRALDGDQWPEQYEQRRNLFQRPTVTLNKIPSFCNQVVNEAKMNRPALKVHANGNGATKQLSKIRQALLRSIELSSDAEGAYDRALECAIQIGKGFFRIYTDYVNSRSFDQKICYGRVFNPFSVYYDPYSVAVDGSDCTRAAITQFISKEEFEILYPDVDFNASYDFASGQGDDEYFWIDSDKRIRIIEYFKLELTEEKLVLFSNGVTKYQSEVLGYIASLPEEESASLKILNKRKTIKKTVKSYKLCGYKKLEENIFPGEYIPIFPVYGNQYCVRGQMKISGVIKDLVEPQHCFNYMKSIEIETISSAPKVQWLAPDTSIEGFEDDYENANIRPITVLKYKTSSSTTGQPITPPQRISSDAMPMGAMNVAAGFSDDMKAISGIYDASLGNAGNEISGAAIDGRKEQGNIGAYHYYDNLRKSIRFAGFVVNHIIPFVIDVQRMERIVNPDGSHDTIHLNEKVEHKVTGEVLEIKNDMTCGDYDCVIDTGASFSTKRQEANDVLLKLAAINPEIMNVAGDLFASNLDFDQSDELAERLFALMPEPIKALKANEGDTKTTAREKELKTQIQQLQQQLQQAMDQNNFELQKLTLQQQGELQIKQLDNLAENYRTEATNQRILDDTEMHIYADLLKSNDPIPPKLEQSVNADFGQKAVQLQDHNSQQAQLQQQTP